MRLLVAAPAGARLDARIAALRVQARLTRLHHALTRFDPASELSQLNERAGATVSVSQTMLEAIAAALHAAHVSEGLVDPTRAPPARAGGLRPLTRGARARRPGGGDRRRAGAPQRRARTPRATWRKIELDAAAGTVRLPAGVRLDLGGSAKGMAVDIAARMLARSPAFAVDAGGDIRLGGTHPAPRTVRIEHPLTGETAHELVRDSAAIATSGLRTRVWRTAEGYAHHLIDPAAGKPAWTGVIQATALAPTTLEAETLAKTAVLLGPDHGHALLARHGGALILDDGELMLAGDLQHRAGHEPALTR